MQPYAPTTNAWRELAGKVPELTTSSVRALFALDGRRGSDFTREACGLWFDFSRELLDRESFDLLIDLAREVGVDTSVSELLGGQLVNNTENRPALHTALRQPAGQRVCVSGVDVMQAVEVERRRMQTFADAVAAGELKGASGRPISDLVNIGIGGSDLGTGMVLDALAEYRHPGLRVHCVSNVDGVALAHVLREVDPERTLFVICSKSFTTLETLTNANVARSWLLAHGGQPALAAQTIAVSTNHDAMDEFGVVPEHRFAIWDWVGGRFSIWSAVGLTVALAIGWTNFSDLLGGANEMDEHFAQTPLDRNLPVLLALVGIWNRNFLGTSSHAVLPYDDHLRRLPAYLQQLEMESNGKSTRRNGEPVECATCPVIFGEPGSNAQHSFYQLLHQGNESISVDFLLVAQSSVQRQDQQDLAIANCLAQAWALAEGDPLGPAENPHRRYPGSRPNSLLLMDRLDPATLGKLIALYEHKVFVQGVIWDVNSFDQWGVELGKRLASELGLASSQGGETPAVIAAALERLRYR